MDQQLNFKIPTQAPPLARCYWVVEGLLLAGAYPGHPDSTTHSDRVNGLFKAGMRTFINLVEENETNNSGKPFRRYDDLLRQLALKSKTRISHLRLSIPDTKVTTVDRMRSILDAIDLSLCSNTPVYVHCFGGMGRTGTVVCCWLLRHGYANNETVLSLLRELRQADVERASWPAPENEQQCKFVLNWLEHDESRVQTPRDQSIAVGKIVENQNQSIKRSGNWFERIFGFTETSRQNVHQKLEVDGNILRSIDTVEEWVSGRLEIASLDELRARARDVGVETSGKLKLSETVGDAKSLHKDASNAGAMFQVASQFNLLEMTSPSVTPDKGITIYQNDPTQGPACAIACAAGTLYRNYFVSLGTQVGQTAAKQVDCLEDIGSALGNQGGRLWNMSNGYALPTNSGLEEIDNKLRSLPEKELDELRSKLKVGIQWNTQVTLDGCSHLVSQVYCSALPIGYSNCPVKHWERFARLVLDASYEATLAATVINMAQTGNGVVYLTLIGGGVFKNDQSWILDAIQRACELFRNSALDVRIVSYLSSNPAVRKMVSDFASR